MLRTFSWLLVPVMLVSMAPAALADVVITKSGERVFGTILTETPVGVSILEPNGLTHGFYADEIAEVRRDPATRTAAGIAVLMQHEQEAAKVEWDRLAKEQEKREAPFHLGHQLTVTAGAESASTLLVGGGAKYRLLVGKYLAAYVGGNYDMGLGRQVKATFDETGTTITATTSVSASAIDVPFGVEFRYQGFYVGGGATYLMATNVPIAAPKPKADEPVDPSAGGYGVLKNVTGILPQIELGYAYQFKQGPLEVGPVVGFEARYALPNKNLPNGLYGGGLVAGWTF